MENKQRRPPSSADQHRFPHGSPPPFGGNVLNLDRARAALLRNETTALRNTVRLLHVHTHAPLLPPPCPLHLAPPPRLPSPTAHFARATLPPSSSAATSSPPTISTTRRPFHQGHLSPHTSRVHILAALTSSHLPRAPRATPHASTLFRARMHHCLPMHTCAESATHVASNHISHPLSSLSPVLLLLSAFFLPC